LIKIVDYGCGNILAFQNAYKLLNIPANFAKTSKDLEGATHIILPGVGAFDHVIDRLERSGLKSRLEELVFEKKLPILGICVGMQIFAESSDEGRLAGLGWIPGEVKSFKSLNKPNLILPHMGWNDVYPSTDKGLFNDLTHNTQFYFLHSYYYRCSNPESISAVTTYGEKFTCAVNSQNVYGVQFHPEKSHKFGMQLLKNFAEI
jgi:glutamine amidotransferase